MFFHLFLCLAKDLTYAEKCICFLNPPKFQNWRVCIFVYQRDIQPVAVV